MDQIIDIQTELLKLIETKISLRNDTPAGLPISKLPYYTILEYCNIKISKDIELWKKMQFGTYDCTVDRLGSFCTGKPHPLLIIPGRQYESYQSTIFLFEGAHLFVYYHELAHAVNYFFCPDPISFQSDRLKEEIIADLVAIALMELNGSKVSYSEVIKHLKLEATEKYWDENKNNTVQDSEYEVVEKIKNLLKNESQIIIASKNIFNKIREYKYI